MIQRINIKVNGTDHHLDIPARRLLVDCLRYDLGLTGTKDGCSVGVCGACTVLVDGELAASCITLAVAVDGAEITTIEGLAGEDGRLHPVQQAFIDHGGFQCGICTPGQIMAAKALLDLNPSPTQEEIREWILYGHPKRLEDAHTHGGQEGDHAHETGTATATQPTSLPLRMPAFEDVISESQLEDLVAYYKAVAVFDPIPDGDPKTGYRVAWPIQLKP